LKILVSSLNEQTGNDPTEEEFETLIAEMTEDRIAELLSGNTSNADDNSTQEQVQEGPELKKQRVEPQQERVVRFLCFAT
jgi:hypothetical protein